MLRWLTATTALATIVAAFGVTWLKYDTRLIEAKLQSQQHQIEKAESDIAVLRAELGFLTRPERLEPLARRYLGLQPAVGHQVIGIDDLPKARTSAGDRSPAAVAPPKSGLAP